MEALRYLIALCFFGLAGGAFLLFGNGAGQITVSNATLTPMGESYALTINMDNPGGPDRLMGVGSEAAGQVMLMGADGLSSLAIPSQSTPSLAMDGAHTMITSIVGDTSDGRLLPITLWFERSGGVETRARIVTAGAMDHGTSYDVAADEPVPTLSITATPEGKDWVITLQTAQFTFDQEAVDDEHQSGRGHGHFYLNGLKLKRVYSDTIKIGALPAGSHTFSVTLNTNDHRAYRVDGAPVSASVTVLVK